MSLTEQDERFLAVSIELSRRSLKDSTFTPFGAVVVVAGVEVGRGTSSVIHKHDPTAHAEVEALRHAGRTLGHHLMPDATLYCSGAPCPMCLVAAWWAGVPRIVAAATLEDSEAAGFEDAGFFQKLQQDSAMTAAFVEYAEPKARESAAAVLSEWSNRLR